MKLIVGLGNPGSEYSNTRHNVGFSFIDYYLMKQGITDKWTSKFEGLLLQTSIYGQKVLFLKPQTFMNLSGDSVRKVMDYYKIAVDELLVVSDDLDLSLGHFKLKHNGSCGGHNGLRDIETKIGTSGFKRLKIGISNDKSLDTKDYVLGKFSKEDRELLDQLFPDLCNVLNDYFSTPFEDLMSRYNRKNK